MIQNKRGKVKNMKQHEKYILVYVLSKCEKMPTKNKVKRKQTLIGQKKRVTMRLF